MSELGQWAGYLVSLTRDTLRVWWRLLPLLLTAYVLGWAGYNAAIVVAGVVLDAHKWLALVVLSVGLVSLLAGIIVCLRLLGGQLHIKDNLPGDTEADGRDDSLTRLVTVTLLPFMGIYAVFGKVQDMARGMQISQMELRGIDFQLPVAKAYTPDSWTAIGIYIAVLVGAYLLRRVADVLHEHTGLRVLGLVTALIEGFFMLVAVVAGTYLVQRLSIEYQSTRLARWVSTVQSGFDATAGHLASWLPGFCSQAWQWLLGTAWPWFSEAMFQPVVWLAVAALIYGSHVLSLAEMWRKGEPLGARLDSQRQINLARRRRARDDSGVGRRMVIELQEAFFGDVDDKYLPTVQSMRLILRVGVLFLGAYLIVYAAITALRTLAERTVYAMLGGHESSYWTIWLRPINLVIEPLAETLRLALLAVAFSECLLVFSRRADPSALPERLRDTAEVGR